MKTLFSHSLTLAVIAALLFTTVQTQARPIYGVSTNRGFAVRGTRGGAIVSENRAIVSGRRGTIATGPNGTVIARRRPHAAQLPAYGGGRLPGGYIRTIPGGYRRIHYGGYACMFVAGVYYREVIYGGETVYVVVN